MEKSIKITLLSASLFALIGVTEAMDMSFDNYDNETSSINIRKTSKLGGNTTKFNNVSKNANLADFIDKKFKENIRTKAEDVLFPNGGNNFIYNDNYLRNYWAYDALVDKSSKFYQSIQNLKYIVLKEQSSSDIEHNSFLDSMCAEITRNLMDATVESTEIWHTVLALCNGFLCSDGIYNSIAKVRNGEKIDVSELYELALKKLDGNLKMFGYYDADILAKIRDYIAITTSKDYKNYFRHDFGCYLNQFWVLVDGKTNDSEPVKSVVSAVVEKTTQPWQKPNKQPAQKRNAKPTVMTKKRETVFNGQNILDQLELVIGCNLETLENNENLQEFEKFLADANKRYKSGDSRPEYDNNMEPKEFLDEGEMAQAIMRNFREWLNNNNLPAKFSNEGDIVRPDWMYYFLNYGSGITSRCKREFDHITNKILEQVDKSFGKLNKGTQVNNTALCDEVNKKMDNNPEYSYEIWRLFRVICTLYGFDKEGRPSDDNTTAIDFWSFIQDTVAGENTLQVLNKIYKTYPTVVGIISRWLMLTGSSDLRGVLTSAGQVLVDSSGGQMPNYAFALLVKQWCIHSKNNAEGSDFVTGGINTLKKVVDKLKYAKVNCSFLDKLTYDFTENLNSTWKEETTTGSRVRKEDGETIFEKTKYYSPVFTATISSYIRSMSYYYTYCDEIESALDDTYSMYRKYCKLSNQTPMTKTDFLKAEGLAGEKGVENKKEREIELYRVEGCFSKARFKTICTEASDTYAGMSRKCLDKLKNIAQRYEKLCEPYEKDTNTTSSNGTKNVSYNKKQNLEEYRNNTATTTQRLEDNSSENNNYNSKTIFGRIPRPEYESYQQDRSPRRNGEDFIFPGDYFDFHERFQTGAGTVYGGLPRAVLESRIRAEQNRSQYRLNNSGQNNSECDSSSQSGMSSGYMNALRNAHRKDNW